MIKRFRYVSKPEKLLNNISSISDNTKFKRFELLKEALEENATNTFKVLFYIRNPRGGLGKRQCFRDCISWIAKKNNKEWNYKIEDNLSLFPVYGRWDDIFCLIGTHMEKTMLDFLENYIYKNPLDKTLYKWMPREKSKNKKIAFKIAKHMKISMKDYRKMLSGNTSVVENLMCSKQWNKIDYEKVPVSALNKYRWAFYRNDKNRYHDYMEDMEMNCDSNDPILFQDLLRDSKYSVVV